MKCMCGCGLETERAKARNSVTGTKKGDELKWIQGHWGRLGIMEKNPHWRGGRYQNDQGYWMVYNPTHQRALGNGYVREHVLLAEKALGSAIPTGAQVHHVNGPSDNSQLVICQDQNYHKLLHIRQAAMRATGNPDLRRCKFCGEYDSTEKLRCIQQPKGRGWRVYHPECARIYERSRNRPKRLSRKSD